MEINICSAPTLPKFVRPAALRSSPPNALADSQNQSSLSNRKPVNTKKPKNKNKGPPIIVNSSDIPSQVKKRVSRVKKATLEKREQSDSVPLQKTPSALLQNSVTNATNLNENSPFHTQLSSKLNCSFQRNSSNCDTLFSTVTDFEERPARPRLFTNVLGDYCPLIKSVEFALQKVISKQEEINFDEYDLFTRQPPVSVRSKSKSLVRQHGFFLSSGVCCNEPTPEELSAEKQYIEPWTEEEQPKALLQAEPQPSAPQQLPKRKPPPLVLNSQLCAGSWQGAHPMTTEKMFHEACYYH